MSNASQQKISLDPAQIGQRQIYKIMIGGIVPRPIAFVSTLSSEGVGNLAPFSFFNGVSSNPPAVMIAITRKRDGSKKDTLRNIEITRQFVVNSVDLKIAGQMNQCSAEYPYGVDEMQKVGLTPVASERVRPPRVAESPIQLECELYNTMEVGGAEEGASTIVVGKIVRIHLNPEIYHDGKILIDKLNPVARLGGISYAPVREVFELPRPKV